jgi:hypothetical protein
MVDRGYETRATLRGPRSIFAGLAGLLLVVLVGWWGLLAIDALLGRVATFDLGYSMRYQRAQWASTVALAAWSALFFSVAFWVLGHCLRWGLGLPRGRPWTRGRWAFLAVRVMAALPLFAVLSVWADDEFFIRRVAHGPHWALGLGVVMCAGLAYDVPRLVRNALACLRARLPLLGAKSRALAELRPGERVQVSGVVAAAPGAINPLIYDWFKAGASPERVTARPFVLEEGGTRVQIDVDPARLVVETEQARPSADLARARICVGEQVTVVGTVEGEGGRDAYRSGPLRIGPGPAEADRLYLFKHGRVVSRRLVLAAVVELLCASGLSLCVAGLIVAWIVFGRIAG